MIFTEKRVLESNIELLKLIFPSILLEHFDLIKTSTRDEVVYVHFEEVNKVPKEYNHLERSLEELGIQLIFCSD